MPKLCDGNDGKKNTSEIGMGLIALCVVRLETYTFNITYWKKVPGLQPLPPPQLQRACASCYLYNKKESVNFFI